MTKRIAKEPILNAIVPSEVEGFYVYILRTSANTLYVGQTNNLEKRIKEHQTKTIKSSKYVRSFPSFKLVYSEEHDSRKSAMQREYQLKHWSKVKKENLIATG
ncbi:MAG TPA: GIY-YIG nuclease family protein [Patescibacteria group bacterium]|nr:GIY-YIG nuclease family protein [Patescibacteria group bacterium]